MPDKFKNKYRIASARLQNWDYGSDGAYFITICTKNRAHYFGEIIHKEMQLAEIGKLAEQFWMDIPNHFPFVALGNFVIMPNHTHGILIIDKPNMVSTVGSAVETPNLAVETPKLGVSTNNVEITTVESTIIEPISIDSTITETISTGSIKIKSPTEIKRGGKNDKWKPGIIGVVLNQYKRIVTINARKINGEFDWQSRFHDHIIRNAQSFETIQNYIATNPENWKNDTLNT